MQYQNRLKTHHSAMGDVNSLTLGPRDLVKELSNKGPKGKKSNIYIHVPFCFKICSFCSMNRILTTPPDNYYKIIIEEIKQYSKLTYIQNSNFDAVYFGGGTPTTLKRDDLREIIKALKNYFNLSKEVEITIETTVTELTDDKIQMFLEEGVNRFSVGVQTFSDFGRKILGRKGDGDTAFQKLKRLKDLKFASVNMDLIYSYPQQSKDDLSKDLLKIYELDLDSFSMYSLINMKGTSIASSMEQDIDYEYFNTIIEFSREKGYNFLELTKMAKRDKYKYIINRHNAEDTLPLGAGAGGNFGTALVMNPVKLEEYQDSVDNFSSRKLMIMDEKYNEIVKIKGAIQLGKIPIDNPLLKNNDKIIKYIEELKKNELVRTIDKSIMLTDDGIYWGNNISKDIISLIKI
jgi:coproporphyrinogen III oxidase-like Fe-S oxidoreductase